MPQDLSQLVFPAAAAVCAAVWVLSRAPARRRNILKIYRREDLPILTRNQYALWLPIFVACLVLGIAPLLPRSVQAWILPLLGLWTIAVFWIAYRIPAPGLPGWLRAMIDSGEVPVATPSIADRRTRWLVNVLAITGTACALWLAMTGQLARG